MFAGTAGALLELPRVLCCHRCSSVLADGNGSSTTKELSWRMRESLDKMGTGPDLCPASRTSGTGREACWTWKISGIDLGLLAR